MSASKKDVEKLKSVINAMSGDVHMCKFLKWFLNNHVKKCEYCQGYFIGMFEKQPIDFTDIATAHKGHDFII